MADQEKPEPQEQPAPAPKSYFQERMEVLGVDPATYLCRFPKYEKAFGLGEPVDYQCRPVFEATPEGAIQINYYNYLGDIQRYRKNGNSAQQYPFHRIRHIPGTVGKDGKPLRYTSPGGSRSFPFLPPGIIDKYTRREEIETLVITEGEFKAVKGELHGLDIVAIGGISMMKDADKNELHHDIQMIIQDCKVKNVILLHDGDARELTSKYIPPEEVSEDLYRRPHDFFRKVVTFRDMLRKFKDVSIFYAAIASDRVPCGDLKPKGLDDLYETVMGTAANPTAIAATITADLLKEGHHELQYFDKFHITYELERVRKWFAIDKAEHFYKLHERKIKDNKFTFHGTEFRWKEDHEKGGELEILVPAKAKDYIRVATKYYCHVRRPRADESLGNDMTLVEWLKSTIIDDHGKDMLRHVRRYRDFCLRPSHDNYQEVIDGCYNTYRPIRWTGQMQEGTWDNIKMYLEHIFGNREIEYVHPKSKEKLSVTELELGIDYIQLLWQKPVQKLPVLCLVSKKKETGKSTFLDLLKEIFCDNAIFVGNSDLASDFNSFWLSKLLVMSDEVFIDKKHQLEMIKNLSTAKRAVANGKNVAQKEEEVFMKFVFTSNDEDKFILTDDEETRYWVRKVPKLTAEQKNPDLLRDMIDEIPAFLQFLSTREMKTDRCNRMWFHTPLIHTEALKHVITHNKSTAHKEIKNHIEELFFMTGKEEIMMDAKTLKEEIFGKNGKYELNYIHKVLSDEMKTPRWVNDKGEEGCRYTYPVITRQWVEEKREHVQDVEWRRARGRAYVFKKADFIDASIMINPDMYESEEPHAHQGLPGTQTSLLDPPKEKDDDLPF